MRIEESDQVMRAAGVEGSTPRFHRGGAGSTPSAALHDLEVRPVANVLAKTLIQRHHYLHTFPVGTVLCFGVFVGDRMVGALTLGVGPTNGHRLVEGAGKGDCLTLTRFWLADDLPPNSASRVLGIVIRAIRSKTEVKFLLTYADPQPGHVGTIYQATGWLYIGRSGATPLYRIGDSEPQHSRTFSSIFGTRSAAYFREHHLEVELVQPMAKHRYLLFLDPRWRPRLLVEVFPYPKHSQPPETKHERHHDRAR